MSSETIRIAVADDHALFRAGLARMLNSLAGLEVVAEASNADEALTMVQQCEADVLTLDLSMPGASSVSLIEKIHALRPALPILILSMHDEVALIRQSLKSGGSGYITKNAAPDILHAAIRELASGGRFVEPGMAERLAFDFEGEKRRDSAPELSPRETQILRMIVGEGLPLTEVAEQLKLSPKTVTAHKANIMAKLGVANNVELIRYAIEQRLFD
jgi:DNA-binding NarL/FixJ family response regulator